MNLGIFSPLVARTFLDPEAVFCIFVKAGTEETLRAHRVLSEAIAIGDRLQSMGVKRGDVVVIVLEHSPWLYSAFIGCILQGFVPSFLPPLTHKQDPTLYQASLEVLFGRIDPAAVITSRQAFSVSPSTPAETIAVEEITGSAWDETADRIRHLPDPAMHDLAFLQHSSGTTGHKKGVMLTHACVLEQANLYARAVGISAGDTVASWLPLYHDMGLLTSFLIPSIVGCPIVSMDALEWVVRPTTLLDRIERHRAAFVWLPNFAFHHISRADSNPATRDLTSLKAIVNCSEPCRSATFQLFADRYAAAGIDPQALKVCYAMAENVFAVTQTPLGGNWRTGKETATNGYISSGAPLPRAEIRIINTAGEIQPPGELGEICIRTSSLFTGYYRLPELSRERLRDGWFYTHDLGCIEDGELFVVGRVDDLLIVNGQNVFAHELEDLVSVIDGVAPGRVVVHGEYDDRLGATGLMVIAELDHEDADQKQIAALIRATIFSQSRIFPGTVRFVPRGFLVKSTSGKLSREQSYRKFQAQFRNQSA